MSVTLPMLDASSLRASGRALPATFELVDDQRAPIRIDKVLRYLPGQRLVAEARTGGQTVLLKLFLDPHQASRAMRREINGLESLTHAGIPTQEVLQVRALADGAPLLLTRYFADSRTADTILADVEANAPCPVEARAMFALVGRLHAAGLMHDDLHWGNFLCAESAPAAKVGADETAPALRLLDGDAVRPAANQQRLLANLALLAAQWSPTHWHVWQQTLLSAYAQTRNHADFPEAAFARLLSGARQRRLRRYVDKCRRDCSEFAVQRSARRVVVQRRDALTTLNALLTDPDDWLARGQILKDGGTCTVACVDVGAQRFIIKRYNIKNWRHAVGRAWRPTRAWHSWINGNRLRHLGLATPTPLAVIEERLGPLRRRAWLVTEWNAGEGLDKLIARMPDGVLPPAVAAALRRLLGGLRLTGLVHGDLKASNLLWDGARFSLIDLDAMTARRGGRLVAGWRRDSERLLRNWPAGSPGHHAMRALLDELEATVPLNPL